jgi:hypothetical protein
LVSLASARLRELFGFRAARVLGVGIAGGHALAMLGLVAGGGADVADVLVVRALGWLSWLAAGSAALAAARDLAELDDRDGISALAAQRGFARTLLEPARSVAACVCIASVVAIPGVALALFSLALSPSANAIVPRAMLAFGVLGYAALLGVTLATLARWSVALSPRASRSVLAALVLVPELLANAWPDVPSVPAVFAELRHHLLGLGAVSS